MSMMCAILAYVLYINCIVSGRLMHANLKHCVEKLKLFQFIENKKIIIIIFAEAGIFSELVAFIQS